MSSVRGKDGCHWWRHGTRPTNAYLSHDPCTSLTTLSCQVALTATLVGSQGRFYKEKEFPLLSWPNVLDCRLALINVRSVFKKSINYIKYISAMFVYYFYCTKFYQTEQLFMNLHNKSVGHQTPSYSKLYRNIV